MEEISFFPGTVHFVFEPMHFESAAVCICFDSQAALLHIERVDTSQNFYDEISKKQEKISSSSFISLKAEDLMFQNGEGQEESRAGARNDTTWQWMLFWEASALQIPTRNEQKGPMVFE